MSETVLGTHGKGRDDYTWEDATRDLALASRLTLSDAFSVVWPLRQTSAHPYDVAPHLVALFRPDSTPKAKGEALAVLIGTNPPDWKPGDRIPWNE